MYNRYIPQNDGSFQKHFVPESSQNKQRPPATQKTVSSPSPQPPMPPQHCRAGSFLKNLLPKEFDTGDLIIVLLLILMAGDCEEEQNTALLTLALYFFM